MRFALLALFAAISFALLAGMHVYLWRRLVRDTGVAHRWRRPAACVTAALAGLVPITALLNRFASWELVWFFAWPAYIWLGLAAFLILGVAAVDLCRLVWRIGDRLACRARGGAGSRDPDAVAGHTHGGQIWPWHFAVTAQQRGYLAGLERRASTQLYVSRGCGYWGPPVRVCAPPEVARIILRSARA